MEIMTDSEKMEANTNLAFHACTAVEMSIETSPGRSYAKYTHKIHLMFCMNIEFSRIVVISPKT